MEGRHRRERSARTHQFQRSRAAEAEANRGDPPPVNLGLREQRIQGGARTRAPLASI